MTQSLKSGAKYMSEFASEIPERRGIAVNRWLQVLLNFVKYQLEDEVKARNQRTLDPGRPAPGRVCRGGGWSGGYGAASVRGGAGGLGGRGSGRVSRGPGSRRRGILQEGLFKEIYAEIEIYKPALEYCLAPKKAFDKHGASSLRAGVSSGDLSGQAEGTPKKAEELDKHARVLYEWVSGGRSRLRMLMNWQCAGGLAYVAAVHQRGVQCFVGYGNSKHEGAGGKRVTMEEFQQAVKVRHASSGNNGMPKVGENEEGAAAKNDYDQ